MQHSVTFHQKHSCRIPNLSQSPDIGQNSNGGISDFRISVQSFINENCHNSEAGNYIGMKLRPSNWTWKEKQSNLKKIRGWGYVSKLWRHCHFSNLWQFGAFWNSDSGRIVFKTYIFINSNLLSYKNRTKKI